MTEDSFNQSYEKQWRIKSSKIALIALLITNCFPIYGVIAWGWNAWVIVTAYAVEAVLNCFFTLIKAAVQRGVWAIGPFYDSPMHMSDGGEMLESSWLNDAAVFVFKYLAAILVCVGLFYYLYLLEIITYSIRVEDVLIMAGLLAISHIVSLALNFIANFEYLSSSRYDIFAAGSPYIYALHFIIFFGLCLAKIGDGGIGFLVSFILIKTLVDVFRHVDAHSSTFLERITEKTKIGIEDKKDASGLNYRIMTYTNEFFGTPFTCVAVHVDTHFNWIVRKKAPMDQTFCRWGLIRDVKLKRPLFDKAFLLLTNYARGVRERFSDDVLKDYLIDLFGKGEVDVRCQDGFLCMTCQWKEGLQPANDEEISIQKFIKFANHYQKS